MRPRAIISSAAAAAKIAILRKIFDIVHLNSGSSFLPHFLILARLPAWQALSRFAFVAALLAEAFFGATARNCSGCRLQSPRESGMVSPQD